MPVWTLEASGLAMAVPADVSDRYHATYDGSSRVWIARRHFGYFTGQLYRLAWSGGSYSSLVSMALPVVSGGNVLTNLPSYDPATGRLYLLCVQHGGSADTPRSAHLHYTTDLDSASPTWTLHSTYDPTSTNRLDAGGTVGPSSSGSGTNPVWFAATEEGGGGFYTPGLYEGAEGSTAGADRTAGGGTAAMVWRCHDGGTAAGWTYVYSLSLRGTDRLRITKCGRGNATAATFTDATLTLTGVDVLMPSPLIRATADKFACAAYNRGADNSILAAVDSAGGSAGAAQLQVNGERVYPLGVGAFAGYGTARYFWLSESGTTYSTSSTGTAPAVDGTIDALPLGGGEVVVGAAPSFDGTTVLALVSDGSTLDVYSLGAGFSPPDDPSDEPDLEGAGITTPRWRRMVQSTATRGVYGFASDFATLTTDTEEAAFPATNVQSFDDIGLGRFWRTETASSASLVWDFGEDVTLNWALVAGGKGLQSYAGAGSDAVITLQAGASSPPTSSIGTLIYHAATDTWFLGFPDETARYWRLTFTRPGGGGLGYFQAARCIVDSWSGLTLPLSRTGLSAGPTSRSDVVPGSLGRAPVHHLGDGYRMTLPLRFLPPGAGGTNELADFLGCSSERQRRAAVLPMMVCPDPANLYASMGAGEGSMFPPGLYTVEADVEAEDGGGPVRWSVDLDLEAVPR